VAGLLGAVRDTDVLVERLEGHALRLDPADRPGAERLIDRLRGQREEARAELLAGLDTPRYAELLERLVVAAREPFIGPDVDPDHEPQGMAELVLRPWRHLAAAVESLGSDPPEGQTSDDALHEVRIRAKRCRYAAEAVGAIVGKPAVAFAAAVAEVQSVLGDFHDAVVAEAWLRETVGLHQPSARASGPATAASWDEVFVAGQLVTIEHQDAQARRAEWQAVWKRAAAGKRRRWIPGA
jgi:CHAD domain-containing protein